MYLEEIDIEFPMGWFKGSYTKKESQLQTGRQELSAIIENKKREFVIDEYRMIKLNTAKSLKPGFSVKTLHCQDFIKAFRAPETAIETTKYNLLLKKHYTNSIDHPEKYGDRRYRGFLFEKGRKLFDQYYENDYNKSEYLEKEIQRVAEFLDKNRHLQNVNYSLYSMREYEILNIIHFEQVKQYYYYLDQLKKELSENSSNTVADIRFKSGAQKIAWMHALGVLQPIIDKCTDEEGNINYKRVAEVTASFIDLKAENIRRCIEPIYKSGTSQNNNPLKVQENIAFISALKISLKLK